MTSDRPYRRGDGPRGRRSPSSATTPAPSSIRSVVEALLAALGDDALIVGCAPGDVAERDQRLALEAIAAELGAEDVFVFRKVARRHLRPPRRDRPRRGMGRQHRASPARTAARDRRSGRSAVRCIAEDESVRVVGPYYARSAVIVPCGHDVIVVFGSSTDSLAGVSERDMPVFGDRVARLVDHVPSAKRLADELEVLDAVRAVTTVNADGVEAALSEISERAAERRCRASSAPVVLTGAGRAMRTGWADLRLDPGLTPVRRGACSG